MRAEVRLRPCMGPSRVHTDCMCRSVDIWGNVQTFAHNPARPICLSLWKEWGMPKGSCDYCHVHYSHEMHGAVSSSIGFDARAPKLCHRLQQLQRLWRLHTVVTPIDIGILFTVQRSIETDLLSAHMVRTVAAFLIIFCRPVRQLNNWVRGLRHSK
jgi:hypothetical protein